MTDRRFFRNTINLDKNYLQLDQRTPVVAEPVVKCPQCKSEDTYVNGTRTNHETGVRLRNRVCRACGCRFVGILELPKK